jgi:tripartite-type tricarboxylate transporter receptor subunit TctC
MFGRIFATALAAAALAAGPALAQGYPDKPVKVIVAYTPGGGADIVARIISQKLSERLGQQFIVVNMPGASGALGTAAAARSDADGYTIFLGQTAEMSILPNISHNLRYDPIKDFDPIAQLTSYPYVIAVHPDVQAKTLPELVAYAKKHPGELNFGTPGVGSSAHLAVELFMRSVGVQFTHIPYRGSGPALQATVAGTLQLIFGDAASSTPLAEGGQVRALAVTAGKRSPKLPNVPTVKETGVADYEVAAWHGFFAPTGTPPAIVERLNCEINAILQDSVLRERFAQDGIEAIGGTPQDFGKYVKSEIDRWGMVAKQAQIKID